MKLKHALAGSLLIVASATVFAGETPVEQEDSIRSVSLPAVERLNQGFPESMRGAQGLMEATAAMEKDEVGDFFILKGEKLREALDRWTRTAGFDLVWQPEPEDGDVRFAANMTFNDTFAGASGEFFKIVRVQTKFDAQLHSNGVLRVFVATANR